MSWWHVTAFLKWNKQPENFTMTIFPIFFRLFFSSNIGKVLARASKRKDVTESICESHPRLWNFLLLHLQFVISFKSSHFVFFSKIKAHILLHASASSDLWLRLFALFIIFIRREIENWQNQPQKWGFYWDKYEGFRGVRKLGNILGVF